MSIDMYLDRSRNQASSVGNLSQTMNSNYDALEKAITQFINDDALKGKAYTSAKQFFSTVLIPLSTSMKTLSDLTKQACDNFVSRYTSEVDSISLKESELEEDIRSLSQQITRYENLNNNLKKHASDNQQAISSNQQIIQTLGQQKHELEEKLRKLREFNQKSPEIFKEVEEFQKIVQQGLTQAQNFWNFSTNQFNIPSAKELDWAKASHEKYLKVAMGKIKQKAEKETLNKADFAVIKAYAKEHPEEDIPKSIMKYINDNKDSIKRDIGLDITSTLLEQGGINASKFGVFINTVGGVKGPAGPNSFVEVKRTSGNVFIENGSKFAKGGKYLGKGVAGVGFGIGMYDDMANDDKTFGEALSHNGMTLAAGSGAGAVVTVGASILLGSNPVGWAVIGGFVAGTLVSKAADWAYQSNWNGIKDKTDWVGHKIDDSIDVVKKSTEKAVDSVGEATKSISNHLNPMKWSW
ncbi:T7SS effector LXG polymorphic toxin [Staphylococcus aureus]|uniref:T7SS effector LXG polymorphic toxin n=1 Tax=Staphylococcus aureus TaxID=1280 RepID=UPI0016818927|nr:T7SS effector LXG polymorphic toxin [Staphylococcus aureus]MBD1439090.1 transposase [Staphylococcus aureus]MBU7627623.1 LXG domain-containing protein [Staphylococcus aureus]MBU7849770.1 LXG domain-containing protein [Staphylococcus aureus]MBU7965858.1 LXG domain-containing protein [Staphylococcus aureus]MDH2953090.1 transposase [Staphylococcus aureus]